MKYKIYFNTLIVFFLLFSFFFFVITVFAVSSNSVNTKVGNPQEQAPVTNPPVDEPPLIASDCPITRGVLTCGTKTTPVSTATGMCGHCGVGYEKYMDNCKYPGNDMAIDIGGDDFQEIKLPRIAGNDIRWTYEDEYKATPAIHVFNGVDTVTGAVYRIQFHHTDPGSGNKGVHMSGEKAAKICGNGCNEKHVHVQLAKSGTWVDAARYMCR